MINELYQLSSAISGANIQQTGWHREYELIPKVSAKNPCVRIILKQKHIHYLESLESSSASNIRKFGSNQGAFPAMNLAPLYRLRGEEEKKLLTAVLAGKKDCPSAAVIRSWCTIDNWDAKFQKRYRNSVKTADKIASLLQQGNAVFAPFDTIREEVSIITDIAQLRKELEDCAFDLLISRKDTKLALQILLYPEKESKKGQDTETSNLSVVFDSEQLVDSHCAVISQRFTSGLNQALMQADCTVKNAKPASEKDAFGQAFAPINEPMPKVKLAAGFKVSLRTMYHGQPSQFRYGKVENATYPISPQLRTQLQSALDWISRPEFEGFTWTRTDKDEALFAYPLSRPKISHSYTTLFQARKAKDGTANFKAAAKKFVSEIEKGKQPGTDPKSERIQLMILRKLDNARTKAVYSYNTTPAEIEEKAEIWWAGCENIPAVNLREPPSLYPLSVSGILNQFWKRDGSIATDKFHPVKTYHGLELLFGPNELVRKDLSALMIHLTPLAPNFQTDFYLDTDFPWKLKEYARDILALLGLFLYKLGYRKENYMKEFPYLLGQLLKISDSLHEMYCRIVRNNDVPPQLAGSSLYTAAAEHPSRTLALLGQRMNPYITWARSYRAKGNNMPNQESWKVGWYLTLYEKTANQLADAWSPQTRFSDEEKAALFIGYLASFPKKENTIDENGGNENE